MQKDLRNILAKARAFLAARRSGDIFISNLMMAGAVALFILFVEQTGAVPRFLNAVLHLLTMGLAALINFRNAQAFSKPGILFDTMAVLAAVSFWTYIRSSAGRILANLLLLVVLVGTTVVFLNRYRIIINAAPIVFGMLLVSAAEAVSDLVKHRLQHRIVSEKQEAEYSVIRHLAHNVKPGLQIARSPLVSLRDFLSKRGLAGEALSRRLDGSVETVGEALAKSITCLGQLNDIIDNTRKLVVQEIKSEDFREHEVKTLLEQEVFPLHLGGWRLSVQGPPCRLSLHRESFVESMHNLLRNAKVHGFPEASPTDEVVFQLRDTRRNIIIDYLNNGRPFPANLSAADFLSFGKKSADSPGEGLGGAWIGKMLESHRGRFEIVRDAHPVHFRITLPKQGVKS